MNKALVVLSGGQDSTTCLFDTVAQSFDEVHAITFDYGQRHRKEIEAAIIVAGMALVNSHEIVELGPILKGSSPLISDNVLEQYANHQSLPGGLEKTFVPMRNQLFLTVAANRAFVLGCDLLVTGVCEEDYGGYPDCRRVFIDALQETCTLGTFTKEAGFPNGLHIETPLMNLTKAQTVRLAYDLQEQTGIPAWDALAYTHTSYDGAYPPTGHDHATLLRAKGFFEANLPDPLILRAVNEDLMSLPATSNYDGVRL